jgi:hypothetical protein
MAVQKRWKNASAERRCSGMDMGMRASWCGMRCTTARDVGDARVERGCCLHKVNRSANFSLHGCIIPFHLVKLSQISTTKQLPIELVASSAHAAQPSNCKLVDAYRPTESVKFPRGVRRVGGLSDATSSVSGTRTKTSGETDFGLLSAYSYIELVNSMPAASRQPPAALELSGKTPAATCLIDCFPAAMPANFTF